MPDMMGRLDADELIERMNGVARAMREAGTPHDHVDYVPDCYRCDLSRAEVDDEVALVVMRSELPEVIRDGTLLYAAGVGGDITPSTSWHADDARRKGFAFLAIAEYLERPAR